MSDFEIAQKLLVKLKNNSKEIASNILNVTLLCFFFIAH